MKLKSWVVILSLIAFFSSQAQSKQKPNEVKIGEIPPPPPPSTPPPGVSVQKMERAEMPPQEEIFDTTPPPADTLTGAIRKMLKLTGGLSISKQFAQMISESYASSEYEKELNRRLIAKVEEPEVQKVYESLIVKIYRQYLTLEDVNSINSFYQSPAGKKYIGLLPSILNASKKEALNFGNWVYIKVANDMREEKTNK